MTDRIYISLHGIYISGKIEGCSLLEERDWALLGKLTPVLCCTLGFFRDYIGILCNNIGIPYRLHLDSLEITLGFFRDYIGIL